ncbi:hypothetical protein N9J11_01240 [Actinomycetota bacterium]|nr:hypothetical protein [Actinomycetota bacterium]
MKLFATIPTRGDQPEILENIVNASGLSPNQFVIVRTLEGAIVPEGVNVIDDFGPINIQRWWATGIKACVMLGAQNVVVANDDIEIDTATFGTLNDALRISKATLACPGATGEHKRSSLPARRKLVGSLWIVNSTHNLFPDERYRWYYGDDDLDIRSRRKFNGIISADVHYNHLSPGAATNRSPEILQMLASDLATFRRQYPIDFAHRRLIERTQGKTGKRIRRLLGATETSL